MIAGKGLGLRGLLGLEVGDGQFDILGAVLGGDQHGVGHGHGDDVVQTDPDKAQAARFGPQQAVGAVDGDGGAMGDHAIGVGVAVAPDRVPTAKVRPDAAEGDDRQVAGFLHHGVVDGNVGKGGPRCCGEAGEAKVMLGPGEGGADA